MRLYLCWKTWAFYRMMLNAACDLPSAIRPLPTLNIGVRLPVNMAYVNWHGIRRGLQLIFQRRNE